VSDVAGQITIRCEACVGTGSMESDDSTDDRWWDCSLCKGSGLRTIPDRRRSGRLAHVAGDTQFGTARACYCDVGRNHP
jgi:hypothetical protein